MKNVSRALSPHEAAQAFYGQDEASFTEMVAKLAQSDPRLIGVFKNTRQRYLNNKDA